MLRIIIFLLALMQLASCTLYTQVPVLKAADVEGIDPIKKVAIINRTGMPKENKVKNVLEGVLTGESVFADRDGAEKCTRGLYDCLLKSLNYDSIVLVNGVFIGKNVSNFPPRLTVQFIDSLCKKLNVDAIVALEYFDSNAGAATVLNGAINPVLMGTNGNPAGNNRNMVIATGWRMYDSTGRVVDEFRGQTWNNYSRYPSGWNTNDYIRMHGLVSGTGYMAGINHAFRISDQWVSEQRKYFKGGSRTLKNASNFARLGDWELAFELWEQATKSMKRKERARALHNLAVYYERKGELETAMQKAKASFDIKHYGETSQEIFFLNQRLANEEKLKKRKKKE